MKPKNCVYLELNLRKTEFIMNEKYGSKPGFLGPAPKVLGISKSVKVSSKHKTALVSGYSSKRDSTSSSSVSMPLRKFHSILHSSI